MMCSIKKGNIVKAVVIVISVHLILGSVTFWVIKIDITTRLQDPEKVF